MRGKKNQIEDMIRNFKETASFLQMADNANDVKHHWRQDKNDTIPSSSQTGHMPTNLNMTRSIGHDLHYSDHQTKVFICNLGKDKLYKKMKFVNNN